MAFSIDSGGVGFIGGIILILGIGAAALVLGALWRASRLARRDVKGEGEDFHT